MDNTKPPKLKPKGKPLRRTEADLDRLSRITPADIGSARELWRENADPKYRKLLDARSK